MYIIVVDKVISLWYTFIILKKGGAFMSKIQGYFLYCISSDIHEKFWFIYPYKIYSTLQGAKSSKIIVSRPDLKNLSYVIVPIKCAFDRTSNIKYMFLNGTWSTDIDEKIAYAFYEWRNK